MGIDGIGKASTPPPLDATASLEPTQISTPVEGTSPSTIAKTESSSSATSVFSRFQSGEITKEQYLDLKVDEAVSPYVNRMTQDQLEFMKTALREQLELDPTLIELTRRATEKLSTR